MNPSMTLPTRKPSRLGMAIDRLYSELEQLDSTSDEYRIVAGELMRLEDMRARNRRTVDPNVLLTVAANVLTVLIIVSYEQKNVVATRALGFLSKVPIIR